MKKILALLMLIALSISLVSCEILGNIIGNDNDTDNSKINIGVMSGPTGMGMAKLMNDHGNESTEYGFEIYSDPSIGTTDLISGKLDMLCLPTNAAANLSAKQDVSVIAINCLGSLYLVSNEANPIDSVADLNGKKIYTSVATSTTKPIIDYILSKNGVTAEIEIAKDHDALVAMLAKGEAEIAVLPEPKVTAALMQNKNYSVELNLSDEWNKVSSTPLTMGCIVVRNDFLNAHKSVVDKFLNDYKTSIEYIGAAENKATAAEMIVNAGVLPKLPIATGALTNLYGSIVYQDGAEMKNSLKEFYTAIGLNQPDDSFYYEK